MRGVVKASTGKSSKQTQHVSASWCGCTGLVDDDPAEEDDDFEVDLEAVDDVSFALAIVSVGFNTLASDSILAATAPVIQGCVGVLEPFGFNSVPRSEGVYAVSSYLTRISLKSNCLFCVVYLFSLHVLNITCTSYQVHDNYF